MTNWMAFSVDLEPNLDGSLGGLHEAMAWYDDNVPRGTVYATNRIANELPDLLRNLSNSHEIGVHVHPKEFDHSHDRLAKLNHRRQKQIIQRTRESIVDATGLDQSQIKSFRAGRHSISRETLELLPELGFEIDASINVQYNEHLCSELSKLSQPQHLDCGIFEIPTTWKRPPYLSTLALRAFPHRTITATASTIRTDTILCSGIKATEWLCSEEEGVSMYMHPHDATEYHEDLENTGNEFRNRLLQIFNGLGNETKFVASKDIIEMQKFSMSAK